jgi:hypothetical protein
MRAALLFVVACIAFAAGVHVRDVEASGGSSKVNLSAYSGSVGISGAVAITGATTIDGNQGAGGLNVSALLVRQGGNSGSLSTPSASNGALIAQGRGGNYGLITKSGNTANAIGALIEATGLAAVFTGDTTSPANGTIRLTPQDTTPTSCTIGDLSVVVNVLKICTAANTWTTVGVQTP